MGICIDEVVQLAVQAGLSGASYSGLFTSFSRTTTTVQTIGTTTIREVVTTSGQTLKESVRAANPDLAAAWANCITRTAAKANVNIARFIFELVELIAPPPLKPIISIAKEVYALITLPPPPIGTETVLCPFCVLGGIPILTLIMLAIAITLKIIDDVQLRIETYVTVQTRGNMWRSSNILKNKQNAPYLPGFPDGDGVKHLTIKQPLPTQEIYPKTDPLTVDLVEYWTISFSRGIGNAFASDIGANEAKLLMEQTIATANQNNELIMASPSLLTQFDTTIPQPGAAPAPPVLEIGSNPPSNKDEYATWREEQQERYEYNRNVLNAWKAANPYWRYTGPILPTASTVLTDYVRWSFPDNGQNAQVAVFRNGCHITLSPKSFGANDLLSELRFINTKISVSEGFDLIPRQWVTHLFSCRLTFTGELTYPSWIGQNPYLDFPTPVPIPPPPPNPADLYYPVEDLGMETEANTMNYHDLYVQFYKRRPYNDLASKERTLRVSAPNGATTPPWEYTYPGVDLRNHGFGTETKALQLSNYGSIWKFDEEPLNLPPSSTIAIRVINSGSNPYEKDGTTIIDQVGVIKNSGGTLGAFTET